MPATCDIPKLNTRIEMKRRQFLSLSGSMVSALGFSSLTACSTKPARILDTDKVIIGGYSHTDEKGKRLNQYGVLAIQVVDEHKHSSDNYQIICDFNVPDEVHLATLYPDGKSILVCSRKPSASLLKYSLEGELIAELKTQRNQHFEGHCIFSHDEKFIYVTASNFQQIAADKQGRILTLNSSDLSLVSDHSSGGIGPHELVWQSESLIAIANTGVITHPDSGRKILNIDNIQSNVALYHTANHTLAYQWTVPVLSLSARHLDRMQDGTLIIGCQYKKQDKRPPCIAFAKIDKSLFFAETNNDTFHWQMQGYTASIKAIPYSNKALITNPRGHIISQWKYSISDETEKQLLKEESIEFNKGLKLSEDGKKAWISQGAGELRVWNTQSEQVDSLRIKLKANIWWANHLG